VVFVWLKDFLFLGFLFDFFLRFSLFNSSFILCVVFFNSYFCFFYSVFCFTLVLLKSCLSSCIWFCVFSCSLFLLSWNFVIASCTV
jgi:hypothetical protein